ncbi:hypothetical protein OE88DRAFT_1637551, partial [Heliocybe sulcata]
FLNKLKDHLLHRLCGIPEETGFAFTNEEHRRLAIKDERIFEHKIMRVNYTTYDVRRDYDIIRPFRDIMVLAPEEDTNVPHPFWYARVLRIWHANIIQLDKNPCDQVPKRMEFLFVRWLGRDLSWKSGWKSCRLDCVGFVPEDDCDAFGFVDPNDIVRTCHLIPAFSQGRTRKLMGHSRLARPDGEEDD